MERLDGLVQVRPQDEEGEVLQLRRRWRGLLFNLRVPAARVRLSLAGKRRRRVRRTSRRGDQLHAARRLDGVVRVVSMLQIL